MKRGTNDSKVNHLLSFDTKYIVELKRFQENNYFPTISSVDSSMRSKPITTKYCFELMFPVFTFCFSLCHNVVFARLASPAFKALLKIGNKML